MYRIELTNSEEFLIDSRDFYIKKEAIEIYYTILNNKCYRNNYKGLTIRLYHGTDQENLTELEKYTIIL